MARFARDCICNFALTQRTSVFTSDSTVDLSLPGCFAETEHVSSYSATTVNTTARVESTGMRNKIHISHETAELLTGSGKGHWITPREDKVVAIGKGEMQTYFLDLRRGTRDLEPTVESRRRLLIQ
jgi:hypothetical protein